MSIPKEGTPEWFRYTLDKLKDANGGRDDWYTHLPWEEIDEASRSKLAEGLKALLRSGEQKEGV